MTRSWFEDLMGFPEHSYEETRANLEVVGNTLRSRVNNRWYAIGELETPSLAELRRRAADVLAPLAGSLRVSTVVGDVGRLHREPASRDALFQVASQFNLLEMVGPDVTPEDGVTRYVDDRTQGPACALAAGPATIYRNYFAPVGGQTGQTRERQIDCLEDLGVALGNAESKLWTMRNGYALCTIPGLDAIGEELDRRTATERDALRDLLRVGLHWRVQVTGTDSDDLLVSQVFCSALPVSYTGIPADRWAPFATLVLEGAYEATLWAAVINAARHISKVVFLTELGGGAFGNEAAWIHRAMRRALHMVDGTNLDVRLVSHGAPAPALERLAEDFA
jgi:hypothetical protein